MKPMQYIYQIEDRETVIKNSGSLPRESPLFGRNMVEKRRFYYRTSLEKLRFTKNNGYGWIGIGMLSSKLVELARQLAGDDRKMAKTIAVAQTHLQRTSCVLHHQGTKLQACGH